ncbi:MAG: macro domain-containing protein, partial [Gammaproteobacteria bacterium]|nr:macro domain-containing protein [Gammaproteobacteria bacterium]
LLQANVEALVNTVNTEGVMGKGIALQFKEAFPDNFAAYEAACQRREVEVGKMFVFETGRLDGLRWIINFPTKKHWRQPSKMDYVRTGLADLVRVVEQLGIQSIAVPPLGCGYGGLDWAQVRDAIEATSSELPNVEFVAFEPTSTYQATPKRSGVEELTPARAMIIDAVRRYSVLGLECTNLEIQKLAYFLQRVLAGLGLANPLRLRFIANKFGPYADGLRHLMDALDGSYLHCEKRLHDAGPFEPIQLDPGRLAKVEEYLVAGAGAQFAPALAALDRLIDGFQSPYLMELLSTVDWILAEQGPDVSDDQIAAAILGWAGGRDAGRRKARLFQPDVVALAVERLRAESSLLYRRVESAGHAPGT